MFVLLLLLLPVKSCVSIKFSWYKRKIHSGKHAKGIDVNSKKLDTLNGMSNTPFANFELLFQLNYVNVNMDARVFVCVYKKIGCDKVTASSNR